MVLSRDADVAVYEAQVFGAMHLESQAVCGGTNGLVAGTQFTAAGVDFNACGVQAGDVLWLENADGSMAGAYEIAEVTDGGHLVVTVLRAEPGQAPMPVGAASGLTWRIASYRVQAAAVVQEISRRLGLRPGCADAKYGLEHAVYPETLRAASVFGVLAMIFEAAQTGAADRALFKEKAAYYRQQFEREMVRARVAVDTNGDGKADRVIECGNIIPKRF